MSAKQAQPHCWHGAASAADTALAGLQADERDRVAAPQPGSKLQPTVWQHVSESIYLHRNRKQQHEDDVMICTCARPGPGQLGCGHKCLNRLLNLECVPVSAQ